MLQSNPITIKLGTAEARRLNWALLRFQRWMKKTNIQYYPEHLETFDWETETGITESQEAIDHRRFYQPTDKCKHKTRKRLLIWMLFSATLKLIVWKMRKLKAYLRPSLTTFCRNFFERTEEKRGRTRARDSFQFSAQYKQLTAILRRNIHLTYPRTMSSENPEMSLQRSESHLFWNEHGKAKEINRKLLRPSTKTKRMSFFKF